MLLLDEYKAMPNDTILGAGSTCKIKKLMPCKWIATKHSNTKWEIRYGPTTEPLELLMRSGKNCQEVDVIRNLIPCSDGVFDLYTNN